MRRIVRGLAVLAVVLALGLAAFLIFAPAYVDRARNPVAAHPPWPVSPQAAALHARLVVADWHADSLLWDRDLLTRSDRGQVDLPRLEAGNVALQVFTAVTKSPAGLNYDQNAADARDNITLLAMGQLWPPRTWTSLYQRALHQADKLHRFAERSGGRLRVIRSEADLDALLAARQAGERVTGGLLGIEGAHPLEGDLARLDGLVAAGYRLVALQHFFDNELGGSLHGIGDQGLTPFGRQVVAEVVRRGLVLDLAHSSEAVAREVLALTDIPLVVSHTGLRSACDTPRNFPDPLMQEIAASGGTVGIGYWADVTCDDTPAGIARVIVAAVALLGEDHVSLGSDFDGTVATTFDTSELAALTSELLAQGLTEAQVAKVMGGNLIRVLRARLD